MMRRLVPAIALLVVVSDAVLVATGVIGPTVALALFRAAQKKDARRTAVAGESASVHMTGA